MVGWLVSGCRLCFMTMASGPRNEKVRTSRMHRTSSDAVCRKSLCAFFVDTSFCQDYPKNKAIFYSRPCFTHCFTGSLMQNKAIFQSAGSHRPRLERHHAKMPAWQCYFKTSSRPALSHHCCSATLRVHVDTDSCAAKPKTGSKS